MVATSPGREAEILRDGVALLVRECMPRRIYLFGSRAKGTAQPTSDFDLAVEGAVLQDREKSRIRELLDVVAGLYSTNLIFLDEVDAPFRALVETTGKVVYEHA
ncbi:MAG: nucleotidyltransferase domain-containing protein [Deltaproteobacteria bacterium]|nr:nucleotidyltransferase domain-containing protein [Deltaproteobacteria bacterium]